MGAARRDTPALLSRGCTTRCTLHASALLNMPAPADRRRRDRVALHWQIRLFRSFQSPVIETVTEDLSSIGFYCTSQEPFGLGERLQCIIVIPADTLEGFDSQVSLRCHVTVVRVENNAQGYGLGCHIEYYDLLPTTAVAIQ